MKAILGIDYGRVRIGLAVSDLGIIARPLSVIINRGERKNLAALAEIVRANNISTIVIGLPIYKDTSMSDEVRAFAKTLEPLGITIAFQNEMLSSVTAEEIAGKKNRQLIDSYAASVILQEYLKGENKHGLQN